LWIKFPLQFSCVTCVSYWAKSKTYVRHSYWSVILEN
jgi:hypothetical protein